MAKALIAGEEFEVVTQLVIENNYGVSVMDNRIVKKATTNVAGVRPVLHRYKIYAHNPEAALRQALSHMKQKGFIDDYVLEASEEAPPPPPPKEKKPVKPAQSPAGDGGE